MEARPHYAKSSIRLNKLLMLLKNIYILIAHTCELVEGEASGLQSRTCSGLETLGKKQAGLHSLEILLNQLMRP